MLEEKYGMKLKFVGFVILIILFILIATSCGQQMLETPQLIESTDNNTGVENGNNNGGNVEGGPCPAVTIDDRKGVEAGEYERLYELEDYQAAADIFEKLGENELRLNTMQSLSALQLRRGNSLEAISAMQASVKNVKGLSVRQKFIKFLMKIPSKLMPK